MEKWLTLPAVDYKKLLHINNLPDQKFVHKKDEYNYSLVILLLFLNINNH